MARSEYRRCPPRRPLWRGVQAAIASEDNHIAASNESLIVGWPVRNAVLRLIRGMNLRLHPCSVAPVEGPEKCGPRRPTPAGSSCNNASHRRGERGPDCRPPNSQRDTSSYTWDEPSTSSLQCGSCGDEKGGPNRPTRRSSGNNASRGGGGRTPRCLAPWRRGRAPWAGCPSRIRCQAATGSWTTSRQWEI